MAEKSNFSVNAYVRREISRQNLIDNLIISTPRSRLNVLNIANDSSDKYWLSSLGHSAITLKPSKAGGEEIFNGYPRNTFDLVLSHSLLEGQQDPEKYLRQISGPIRSYGDLSLLASGLYARQAGFSNEAASQETPAFKPDELRSLLRSIGYNVLHASGIGLTAEGEGRSVNSLSQEQLAAVLQKEKSLSQVEEVWGMAQIFQFIARKR